MTVTNPDLLRSILAAKVSQRKQPTPATLELLHDAILLVPTPAPKEADRGLVKGPALGRDWAGQPVLRAFTDEEALLAWAAARSSSPERPGALVPWTALDLSNLQDMARRCAGASLALNPAGPGSTAIDAGVLGGLRRPRRSKVTPQDRADSPLVDVEGRAGPRRRLAELLVQADQARRDGHPQEALAALQQALSSGQDVRFDDTFHGAAVFAEMAEVRLAVGDRDPARHDFFRAALLYSSIGEHERCADALVPTVRLTMEEGDRGGARSMAQRAAMLRAPAQPEAELVDLLAALAEG